MTVAATTISTTASTSDPLAAAPPIITSVAGDHKFRGETSMSSNNKPPLKSLHTANNIGSNTSPSTPTPRLAASQRPASNSLHPNVTTRSPRSAARKGRAETICSPDSELHLPAARPSSSLEKRPSSATGSRVSVKSEMPSNYRQQTTTRPAPLKQNSFTSSGNGTTPKFFHANQTRPTRPSLQAKVSSTPPLSSPRTPLGQPAKFFHADSIPTSAPRSHSPTPPVLSPRLPGQPGFVNDFIQNPHAYIDEFTSSRPSSMVGGSRPASVISTTPSTHPEPRSHVKFVYANGTEEILPPRRLGSEVGSAAPSPQIAQAPFSSSPTGALSPLASPNPAPNPQTQLFKSPHSSPRSSIDASTRHGRALSISSTIDMMNMLKGESTGEDKDSSKASDDDALSAKAAAKAKIKAMEEAAANARRERKVLDLEISNASLMAINKTLERQMRKQTAELRRYRRLSRTGRLASLSTKKKKKKLSGDGEEVSDSPSASDEKASDADEEEDEEESDEEDEDSSEENGDDEREDEEEKDGNPTAVEQEAMKEKAPDGGRLDLDLSKHQALLEASAKMNVSLKRCQYIAEQLIKEGKKALEYKVQPSDVHLGGRVLTGDNDEEFEGETEDNEDSRMENTTADETGDGDSEDDEEDGDYSDGDQDSQDDEEGDEDDEGEDEDGSSGEHDEDDETSGGEDIYPFRDADRVMLPKLAGYVRPTT
ncbi:hypothetical protein L873DRAFT_1136852 [Choiromyces venosus 120613-1]|uniref:Uncharacterized protein n=1 Tax=Choiromyces venosus 120613-1 TaxID=1336337 RepID=A0A3N4JLX0_9PEZI|nr:hypothetical protein L873DRAFT_1136852 [Choiromyces venosus 120613-1]